MRPYDSSRRSMATSAIAEEKGWHESKIYTKRWMNLRVDVESAPAISRSTVRSEPRPWSTIVPNTISIYFANLFHDCIATDSQYWRVEERLLTVTDLRHGQDSLLHSIVTVLVRLLFANIVRVRVTVTLRTVGSHAVRIASTASMGRRWRWPRRRFASFACKSRFANYDTSSEIYWSLFSVTLRA